MPDKVIKICHKNCNTLIEDMKIHSRTISDQNTREQNVQRRKHRLIGILVTIMM